jgi:hypothetical protein
VWLVPVLGAVLASYISRESVAPNRPMNSQSGWQIETGTQLGGGIGGPSSDGSSSGGPFVS